MTGMMDPARSGSITLSNALDLSLVFDYGSLDYTITVQIERLRASSALGWAAIPAASLNCLACRKLPFTPLRFRCGAPYTI
ncbi:hypothetical protein SAMN05421736_10630 [Evansella caseinilytica]|uniref:Uncharacterized protein n=1 Tax=Evansella caseinilytica TaxID=1503961 RepID=A0A1H3Q6F2_9BACI|nr:hypothetical protein SAMN05421736_10630 [Evansella caseinilytica]